MAVWQAKTPHILMADVKKKEENKKLRVLKIKKTKGPRKWIVLALARSLSVLHMQWCRNGGIIFVLESAVLSAAQCLHLLATYSLVLRLAS